MSGSLPSRRRLQAQHVVHHVEHLVVGDVLGRRRELGFEQLPNVLDGVAEARVGVEERLGDHRGDVEVVDFLVERLAGGLDGGRQRIQVAVLLRPNHEAG